MMYTFKTIYFNMSFTISENESYKGFDKSKLFHSTIPLCVSESSSEKKSSLLSDLYHKYETDCCSKYDIL